MCKDNNHAIGKLFEPIIIIDYYYHHHLYMYFKSF